VKDQTWHLVGLYGKIEIGSVFNEDGTSISLSGDMKTLTINFDKFDINALIDSTFNGFTSRSVYLDISVQGGAGQILVTRLNNQTLANVTSDDSLPEIYTEQKAKGVFEHGSTYTVLPAYADDVLDTGVIKHLTVKLPNGQFAVSTDGITMQEVPMDRAYDIVLSEVGEYRISYFIESKTFNTHRPNNTFTILVVDDVAPQITLPEDGLDISASVGEKGIDFEPIAATDNYDSGALSVYVYVIDPNGGIILASNYELSSAGMVLNEDYGYAPKMKGDHTILYKVFDSTGNCSTAKGTLKVS
jgi:hypothetical protein